MTSDAVARDAASEPSPPDASHRWSRYRQRRFAAGCVLALGVLMTALGAAIVLSCLIDDQTIGQAPGAAVAEVIDTSPTRTVVRFTTGDGRVYIPQNGVLYPSGLQQGQFVRVEYDRRNPALVGVAGRSVQVALLPVGSMVVVVWAVLLPAYWLLRRPSPAAGTLGT